MITIAVVPVMGVLTVFLLTTLVMSRRASAIADLRRDVEETEKQIRDKEQKLIQATLHELAASTRPEETLKDFLMKRADLLNGKTDWSDDDLIHLRKKNLREGSEAVNRRMMMPAVGGAVTVVAICVVVIAVLYNFQAGHHVSSPALTPAASGWEDSAIEQIDSGMPPISLEPETQMRTGSNGT